jgi:hypothetical protein
MAKHLVASLLWYLAVAWGWNYIAALTGLPSIIGLGLGAAVAAFVAIDPFHLVWAKAAADAPASEAPRQATVPGAISSRI